MMAADRYRSVLAIDDVVSVGGQTRSFGRRAISACRDSYYLLYTNKRRLVADLRGDLLKIDHD